MKTTFKSLLAIVIIAAFATGANAQVVMKDFVSMDHTGTIVNSVNNNGSNLYWKLEYKSTDRARIYYDFVIYKDAAMKDEMGVSHL